MCAGGIRFQHQQPGVVVRRKGKITNGEAAADTVPRGVRRLAGLCDSSAAWRRCSWLAAFRRQSPREPLWPQFRGAWVGKCRRQKAECRRKRAFCGMVALRRSVEREGVIKFLTERCCARPLGGECRRQKAEGRRRAREAAISVYERRLAVQPQSARFRGA